MADLMEFEEPDPADALRELLAQRERAKKAVYAAAVAREKAEEELARREKLFQMQIEEIQKLALENAGLRRAKEELGAHVKLVEDAAMRQALVLAKKDEQLERYIKLVTRVEEAIYEEELSPQEEEIVEKAEKWTPPPVAITDSHEGPHGYEGVENAMEKPESPSGLLRAATTLKRIAAAESILKRPFVLVNIVALPFLVMTFFNILMLAGIKVEFVADLITPLWQPWMSDPLFPLAVALVPAALYASLFFSQRRTFRTNGVSPLEEVLKTEAEEIALESPAADIEDNADVDDYLKQIDEIFGGDEDDKGTKQSQ